MSDSDASQALLSAALGGLLCLAACGGDSTENGDPNIGSSGGAVTAESCKDGVVDKPAITKTESVADLSLDAFTADCNARSGTVEVHPHCGGVNNCRGFSYDSDTDTLTEHTCKGANTCTGFSCVVCKPTDG